MRRREWDVVAKKRKRKRIKLDTETLQVKVVEQEETTHEEAVKDVKDPVHFEELNDDSIFLDPMFSNQPIDRMDPEPSRDPAQNEEKLEVDDVSFNREEMKDTSQVEEKEVVQEEAQPESNLELEIEALKKQVAEYEALTFELQQKLAMAHADYENFRRRARKEQQEALKYASAPLIEMLLPVLDNFERALEAADVSEDAQGIKQGIEMVYRQFLQVLSQSGLTLIEAEGKPFNPHEHNAVMQVESDQYESGIVVEELQSGYRYKDRVIRPSMVKVSS
jgi:molecular chaperone GrpE